ncbi:polyphosphate kinase 1 [Endothiovibrio diazotrophicus]
MQASENQGVELTVVESGQPETPPSGTPVAEATPVAMAPESPVPSVAPPVESAPEAAAGPDLDDPALYLNRELTWLAFNRRVLHEAQDERTPLLERLKFTAIVSANLDEFFMKRIGGLKQQVGAGVQKLTVDGRTPQQQIEASFEVVHDLEDQKEALLPALLARIAEHEIQVVTYASCSEGERDELRRYFYDNIYPLITPQAMDPAHPFPFVSNLSLNLLVGLQYPGDDDQPSLARVKVPSGSGVSRFLKVGPGHRYVPLEDVMAHNLDMLFPGMEVISCEFFRVTRNANTERAEEHADDLLSMIESELQDRRFAPIVRMEIGRGMDPVHRGMLAAELGLDEVNDVFEVEGMMAMRDLFEIAFIDLPEKPELHDPAHRPVDHHKLVDSRNIFHIIRDNGPLLLQHPFESFSTSVERFVKEAAEDPKVLAIKMTLYRTSKDTKILDYLVEAAQNGKQVAVVVELKARFDEAANIRWAERLEAEGIHVTYGVVGLKTHSKVIMVVRRDYSGLRRYLHIGTGNYHAGTARIYCDLGMLTNDEQLGQDATELFNYLTTGYTPKRDYKKMLPAPKHLKRGLLSRIEREIDRHCEEGGGLIQFKMNALEDKDITRALYEAARVGVKVDLIVRDTCRIRPGVPGLSESVRVIGIVGRFLEHTRIFYFRNGGEEEYFIGSADCMMRNLESRVEVVAPVESPALRERLRNILDTQLNDRRGAWEMDTDGNYHQRMPEEGGEQRHSQQILLEEAEARLHEAKRLRKRKTKGLGRRNVR